MYQVSSQNGMTSCNNNVNLKQAGFLKQFMIEYDIYS